MGDRFSGFLTPADKEALREIEETDENNRQERFRIRQRTARALRDLVIVQENLPGENYPGSIFDVLFQDTWEELPWSVSPPDSHTPQAFMRALFRFVFAGSKQHLNWADEGMIENFEDWIRVGLKQAFPEDYFDVNITRIPADELDELEYKFRESKSEPDGPELTDQEMTALFQSQRISVQEYLEHTDHSDIVDISGDPTPQNEES